MLYKNLFFDLDDTLWAFSLNARDTYEEMYWKYGYDRYFDSFEHYYSLYQRRNLDLWAEYADGKVTKYTITPEQFGFTRCRKEDLVGGTPEENAALVKEILEGKVTGAKLDAVLINAGAAIHVAKNVSMEEGIKEAREMITSGKALATMEQFIAETNAA